MLQVAKSQNVLLFVTSSHYKTKFSIRYFSPCPNYLFISLYEISVYFPKSYSPDQETMNTKLCDKFYNSGFFAIVFFSFSEKIDWLKKS